MNGVMLEGDFEGLVIATRRSSYHKPSNPDMLIDTQLMTIRWLPSSPTLTPRHTEKPRNREDEDDKEEEEEEEEETTQKR